MTFCYVELTASKKTSNSKVVFIFSKLTAPKSRITNVEVTVVKKLNQGTFRHRAVIDGGALFGSFLGKQKGTTKTSELHLII